MTDHDCFGCRQPVTPPMLEWHHFPVPKSLGGEDTVPMCKNCHSLVDRTGLANWPAEYGFAAIAELLEHTGARLLFMKLLNHRLHPELKAPEPAADRPAGLAGATIQKEIADALCRMEDGASAERVKEALAHVGRSGRARSRLVPFGWRTADGSTEQKPGDRRELVEHRPEQEQLQTIRALRGAGLGARRIAAVMNEAGSINIRRGRPWTSSGIASLLRRLKRWESAGIAVSSEEAA